MNIINTNKCTPLHVAVNKGHTDVVRVLVKANCDVNVQDSSGDTAIHDAITKDQPDIINILINSNKCDLTIVNQQGFNPFHRAALKGREQ
jgi:E3 ubiquitin-protein ligase mind-bomb